MSDDDNLISVIDFSKEIDSLVKNKNIPYIDAVILWCERKNIEIEYAADWIKKDEIIRMKIQYEAEQLHTIKKTSANLINFMI